MNSAASGPEGSNTLPEVRRLIPADFDQYYALRLAGLVECPAAFTTDADAWRSASKETIERHLLMSESSDAPILGAWKEDGELVGILGLNREQRQSVSHKAGLWGFYVSAPHRRQGIGETLLTQVISWARAVPELRQLRAVVPTSSMQALSLMGKMGFQQFGLERDARQVNGKFHDQVYFWYLLGD